MRTLTKWWVAAAAIAALAGCATYPYAYSGYGYDRPYAYGYDSGPYPYGPYAYDPYYYGYPSYPPYYYYGAPALGLSLGFSSALGRPGSVARVVFAAVCTDDHETNAFAPAGFVFGALRA